MLTWVCFCMTCNISVGTFLYFDPNFWDQTWRCTYCGAKLAFIAGIFLKKYPWYTKIYLQFHFFAIWSTSASILSIIVWKALVSNWSPSELAIFLKIDPRCFGPFGKFQDTKEISMQTARFSRLSFRFLWLRSDWLIRMNNWLNDDYIKM